MNGDFGIWGILLFSLALWGCAAPAQAETMPPEVEAIRAEREAQRAALDRIRRKVEALHAAEAQRAAPRTVQSFPPAQRPPNSPAARPGVETPDLRNQIWRWALFLFPWIAGLYGAFFVLLLFPPYLFFIEYWVTHSTARRHPMLFGMSALCVAGSAWLLLSGRSYSDAEWLLLLSFLGLPFASYFPGFLWYFLVFLHSLFVPHPLEPTFKRVLRGEAISKTEAEALAASLYNAERDGLMVDWRVQNRIRRLERLAILMGKEKAVVDTLIDHISHSSSSQRRFRS